jgi:hypothetical protein
MQILEGLARREDLIHSKKEGRKEGRKERGKEGRKEGRK